MKFVLPYDDTPYDVSDRRAAGTEYARASTLLPTSVAVMGPEV